jgi:outer membrane biosynthesis protein TonB
LTALKEYAERVLAPRGIYPFATGTKIGFDAQVAHPKLTFRATTLLDEDEAAAVLALRESEIAHRILAEADELAAAGITEADGSGATDTETDSALAAASVPKKAKLHPVEEEEIEEEIEEAHPAPKAKPKKAVVEEEEVEEAPPAPKAKPKKAVVEEEEVEEAPPAPRTKSKKAFAAPSTDADFDAMLDSILK